MAEYNQWMNARLYAAARTLPDAELAADRKAFFGSLFGTLNHLAAGDTIWLQRFAQHPAHFAALDAVRALAPPAGLSQMLFPDFDALAQYRQWLDGVIIAWAGTLTEADLDHVLRYQNTRGDPFGRNFFSLLMHFFNHQTHHRGQATTLLSQAGVAIGDTDLLALIPNVAP
ncbi:DinB family protein [Janthinobacterium fluminis]|uniref:DinB family protein n=1 Tax=Janthinobacterium fluminis TaxID=2987524 RepID=A0ABT5JZF7_9BURK|nr:DinB family protein [Janthinobacterium fluminis]MDC8758122.1 DinB family protein [Janthinobacterium fluminis]